MRFCPRIRSLHRQRIYCADPGRDHGVLEPVLKRGRRAVNFRLIAEQWDRIGQFYAEVLEAFQPVPNHRHRHPASSRAHNCAGLGGGRCGSPGRGLRGRARPGHG